MELAGKLSILPNIPAIATCIPITMYQPEQDIDDLISRYIHAPQDPFLQEQMAGLCREGPEQAAYVESRLTAWLAEGIPVPHDVESAVPSSSPALSKRSPVRAFNRKWLVAAAVMLLVTAMIVYYCQPAPAKQLGYVNNTGHTDSLLLAPGCTVIAGNGASFSYAKGLDVTPELRMLAGDAWFDVALPTRTRMQLDEHTDLYTLKAVFAVHKTNNLFKVLVINGKVTLVQDQGKKVYLTANMLAKREQHQPLQFKTVKSQSLLAWKTGRLKFRNIPLEEIIDAVNSYFHLDIRVPPSAAGVYKRSLTVDFENKSAEETLELLQKMLKVPLVKDSANRYYITLK